MIKANIRILIVISFIVLVSITIISPQLPPRLDKQTTANINTIVPAGDTVYNNGGTILQYDELYAANDSLFFTEATSFPEKYHNFVTRLMPATGAVTRLGNGKLCYLDPKSNDIYYLKQDMDPSKCGARLSNR